MVFNVSGYVWVNGVKKIETSATFFYLPTKDSIIFDKKRDLIFFDYSPFYSEYFYTAEGCIKVF
jgi:hypothetical protein